MKLIGKLIAYPVLAVNILVSALLIFSCYVSLPAPIGRLPFASLSGLAFPMLFGLDILLLFMWLFTWKKGALVSVITLLICLSPIFRYFPIHPFKAGKVEQPYITVMTYNTEGLGIDDNSDRTLGNPVLRFILQQEADIVLLQEAPKDVMTKASKDAEIRKKYPYITIPDEITSGCCLSKYKILGKEVIKFENSSNSGLYLRVLAGQDTIAVYNCHLESNRLQEKEISEYYRFIEHPTDNSHYEGSKKLLKKLLQSTSLRAGQASLIAERARADKSRYVIVCGDFNDTPLSYSHHQFNLFMTDAYAVSGNGAGYTYHEHRLYYRIDHIFCSRNITPLHTWVDRTQKDSDHYPVISRLRLK